MHVKERSVMTAEANKPGIALVKENHIQTLNNPSAELHNRKGPARFKTNPLAGVILDSGG